MSKRRIAVAVFLFLLGTFPLMNSLSNPRTQALHGSDRLQLIAVGFCFGVGFGALVGARKFRGDK
jgi:hypothetical protein